ncbi:hypothetical protein ACFS07_11125 [Undibacterium arcticum]
MLPIDRPTPHPNLPPARGKGREASACNDLYAIALDDERAHLPLRRLPVTLNACCQSASQIGSELCRKSRYTIRVMTRQEVDIAIDWAAAEGWNPGLYDANCFYAADPNGFLIGLLGDEPIATVSVVKYGDSFGFLGFFTLSSRRIVARATEFRSGTPVLRSLEVVLSALMV